MTIACTPTTVSSDSLRHRRQTSPTTVTISGDLSACVRLSLDGGGCYYEPSYGPNGVTCEVSLLVDLAVGDHTFVAVDTVGGLGHENEGGSTVLTVTA